MSDTKMTKDDLEKGLDGEDDLKLIELESKEKDKVQLQLKYAKISRLVYTAVDQDASATKVSLPSVSTEILDEVVKFMEHHEGEEPPMIPKPLRSKEMKSVCQDRWDATYIDGIAEDRQKLYDLMMAANYMDIKSLLHLACAKVASLIKGQPLEKIKEILQPSAKNTKDGESA